MLLFLLTLLPCDTRKKSDFEIEIVSKYPTSVDYFETILTSVPLLEKTNKTHKIFCFEPILIGRIQAMLIVVIIKTKLLAYSRYTV